MNSMSLTRSFALVVFLLAFASSANCCFSNHETTPLSSGFAGENKRLLYNKSAKPHDSSAESEKAPKTDTSGGNKCAIEPQSRFNCATDRLVSQRECEDRGCCYAPVLDSVGPPWCFYPGVYPGYRMGPFAPSAQGKAATLTPAAPSYLPRDVSVLTLEVIEETAGCFHITVSPQHFYLYPF